MCEKPAFYSLSLLHSYCLISALSFHYCQLTDGETTALNQDYNKGYLRKVSALGGQICNASGWLFHSRPSSSRLSRARQISVKSLKTVASKQPVRILNVTLNITQILLLKLSLSYKCVPRVAPDISSVFIDRRWALFTGRRVFQQRQRCTFSIEKIPQRNVVNI